MRGVRAFLLRVINPLRRRGREDDLAAELESHLQLHIDDGVRAGLTPAEARRQAVMRLGGLEQVKEGVRERWSVRALDHLGRDLRLAVRQLRTSTSLSAVAMLAIAIGLTTAMFAVVDAILIRPVPFRDADRIGNVTLFSEHGGPLQVAPAVLRAWRAHGALEAAEGTIRGTAVIDAGAGPSSRVIAYVSPRMFEMLGVRALRGRVFDPGVAPDPAAAVISEDLWRAMFESDPSIIGRRFQFDRETLAIVGVLPAGVHFPDWDTQVWRARDFDGAGLKRADWPGAYVRLRAGVARADALRELTEIARQADPATQGRFGVWHPLAGESNERYYRSAMPLLAGGVALVFLALCANVACLLLARFTAQRQQFQLCSALGASRGRLIGQALVEAAVVAAAGCAAGVLLAQGLVTFAAGVLPRTFLAQTLRPLRIDAAALVLAIGLGGLSALISGLLPAWTATRRVRALGAAASRTSTDTRGARSLTRVLLVAEMTFACALLVGAGLMGRSFLNLTRMDLGFEPEGLMSVSLFLSGPKEQRAATAAAVDAQFHGLPGIQQVVWSGGAPMAAGQISFGDYRADTATAPVKLEMQDFFVSRDFFALYGITLLKGRAFTEQEDAGNVIIGERLARALWPAGDPVGHRFTSDDGIVYQVIGVAREPRRPLVGEDAPRDFPTRYFPAAPGSSYGTATLQCSAACPSEGVVRQRLLALGPVIQGARVAYLEELLREDLSQPRATALVSALFASVALLAAAGGLFSVLNYAVARRRREFGIRTALGSSSGEIGRLVIRDSLSVIAAGIGGGVVLAWLFGTALASIAYGVTASDPIVWIVVLVTVGFVAIVASWWPARSAMRVNPVELLREE